MGRPSRQVTLKPARAQTCLGSHSSCLLARPLFEILPWLLTGRLHGSCPGIVPHDTSPPPHTHSVAAGSVGVPSLVEIPSRQGSEQAHMTGIWD